MQSTTILAFDQHAATTVAAVLLPNQRTPALHSLTSDTATIVRFVERLRRQGAVRCCYEAGPCGFELQRALTSQGIACDVIAPSLIPRRPGDRVKTDRRDAGQLAILYRAGALTPIHIPTDQEEAARDLLRCREDIRADLLRARHRLSKFLLRHGRRFTGTKKAWSKARDAWLRAQRWPLPALDQTHAAYLRTVDEAVARLRTVEDALRGLLTLEPLRPRVERLRCFRGIDDLTALTIAAELGDPRRFASAPRTMAFVAWSRRSIPAGRNEHAARSPKPETRMCDASWSKPPGTTAIGPLSAPRSGVDNTARRPRSSRTPGPRSSACIVATIDWPRGGNPTNTSSRPSPANSPASSGRP